MPKTSNCRLAENIADGKLPTELRIECRPIDDRSLLNAIGDADTVVYLTSRHEVDHPVFLRFRALVTRLNTWSAAPNIEDASARAELAVERRSIALRLNLAVYTGNAIAFHRGKLRRVLTVFFASPETESVIVTLSTELSAPRGAQ
jgi:hypothetical protein